MFSKTQSHWKDKADITPTSPEPPPLWLLLWPPYNPFLTTFFSRADRLFLLVFRLQRSVCSFFHSCKYCCLALVQEWMGSGRDTKFLPAGPILLFFSTAMAPIACAVSKNAILTAHLDHRWVFYFSQGLQNRVCGKLKLVWQCFFFFFKVTPYFLYCPSDIKS